MRQDTKKLWIDIIGLVFAFAAFLVSVRACKIAQEANRISNEANTISRESNEFAKEANLISREANSISKNAATSEVIASMRSSDSGARTCYDSHLKSEVTIESATASFLITNNGGRACSLISAEYEESWYGESEKGFDIRAAVDDSGSKQPASVPLDIDAGKAKKVYLEATRRTVEEDTPTPDPQKTETPYTYEGSPTGEWKLSFNDGSVFTQTVDLDAYQLRVVEQHLPECSSLELKQEP